MSSTDVNDALALAAVDRAVRHDQARASSPAPAWAVYEHAGVSRRSRAGRELRARLAALDGSALLRRRRSGVETWELTARGKRRLSRLRAKGELPELPESPQHRAWRETRALAGERIEGFRLALLHDVEYARELLADSPAAGRPSSDVWLELGERLHDGCRRLGLAAYCVYEWVEPDDLRADVDLRADPGDEAFAPKERYRRRARRSGRRNTRLWDRDRALKLKPAALVGRAREAQGGS